MYQHIMVPLDGSEVAECVLTHVLAITTGCAVTKVTLVRVVEPLHVHGGLESRFNPEERENIEKESTNVARSYLDQIRQQFKEKGIGVQTEVLHGHVAGALLDYAIDNEVDLIILATHGRSGVSRWFLGSVADQILRSAPLPVMTVRPPGCEPPV